MTEYDPNHVAPDARRRSSPTSIWMMVGMFLGAALTAGGLLYMFVERNAPSTTRTEMPVSTENTGSSMPPTPPTEIAPPNLNNTRATPTPVR